jgi:cellulose synthase/poly-beta-1,6-N-acetylglucosamine synthase-like glycosyltransferase
MNLFITVIIPTYRRPKDLFRCLEALVHQNRSADEVIVVVRDTDNETVAFLENCNVQPFPLSITLVKVPGVVAAMNMGLDTARGDIIAFTDDDAAPHQDWLERIEAHFLDNETIGGVGGCDFMYIHDQLVKGEKATVGRLQWFGRAIGNHHLGKGDPREVDFLKGVNMSFRRSAISGMRFDERMRGTGAQVHFEIMWCLSLRKRGWKLIYDPSIAVDHHLAQRFDEDVRGQFNALACTNAAHNETLALLEYLPTLRQVVFLLWAILIGTRACFGILMLPRFLSSHGTVAIQMLLASWRGRFQGWQSWRASSRTESDQIFV